MCVCVCVCVCVYVVCVSLSHSGVLPFSHTIQLSRSDCEFCPSLPPSPSVPLYPFLFPPLSRSHFGPCRLLQLLIFARPLGPSISETTLSSPPPLKSTASEINRADILEIGDRPRPRGNCGWRDGTGPRVRADARVPTGAEGPAVRRTRGCPGKRRRAQLDRAGRTGAGPWLSDLESVLSQVWAQS